MDTKLNKTCSFVNVSFIASHDEPYNNLFMTPEPNRLSYSRFMELAGLRKKLHKPSEVAKAIGVSHQTLHNWERRTFVPPNKHADLASFLGLTIEALLGRSPRGTTKPAEDKPHDAATESPLTPEEDILLLAFRRLPLHLKDAILAIIHSHMDDSIPQVSQFLGRRNPEHQRKIEPKLITKQIISQSKATTERSAKRPKPKE